MLPHMAFPYTDSVQLLVKLGIQVSSLRGYFRFLSTQSHENVTDVAREVNLDSVSCFISAYQIVERTEMSFEKRQNIASETNYKVHHFSSIPSKISVSRFCSTEIR
jgi:hypothetical protein